MNANKRNYRATFILDNRGKEDSVEQLIDGVKAVIAEAQGEVTQVNDLGRRDFIRITNPKFTAANYVQIDFSAPATGPADLKNRLRLNNTVYRTFIQSL